MSERPCPHCAIIDAINADATEHRNGEPLIDGSRALYHLGRVAAQIIASADSDHERVALLMVLNGALVSGLNDHGVEARAGFSSMPAADPVRH